MPFPILNIHRPYNSVSTTVLHCCTVILFDNAVMCAQIFLLVCIAIFVIVIKSLQIATGGLSLFPSPRDIVTRVVY